MFKCSRNTVLVGWSIAKIPSHRGKYLLSAILIWGVSTSCKLEAKSIVKPVRATSKAKNGGVPTEINYQGWLGDTTDTTEITDVLGMIFRLYTSSTGGSPIWNESHIAIPVDKGIFNVLLGSVNPIPSNIFTGDPLWLETQVMTDTLSPRKKLVSVGYAIKSEEADHSIHSDTAGYALAADVNIDSVAYADTAGYASSSAPDSDWTLSGSKLYAQDTSWNVGIGTTSPSFKLDVEGGARFWNSSGDRSGVQIGTIAGSGTGIEGIASDGNLTQPMYINYHSSGEVILAYGGGKVGIGTASPSTDARLDVRANGADYGVLGQGSTGKQAAVFGLANGASYGVWGCGSTGKMAGVFGSANGASYGVYGCGSTGKVASVYGLANGADYAGYFDGDVHIKGTVTMDTVVRYYSIPACDFGATHKHYDWFCGGQLYALTSGTTYWCAGVHLPDGAVVTEVMAYIKDDDATDITIYLNRLTPHTGASSSMAGITSSGASSDFRMITDNTISIATINNVDYCYYAQVLLKSGNNKHRLCQFRIKYEITRPLP